MDLKKVQKLIRNAWIAGIISGTGTIIMMLNRKCIERLGYFAIVDVLLFYGLSFGIYKRSRACATAMVVYFIFAKTDFIGNLETLPIFLLHFFLCMFCLLVKKDETYLYLQKAREIEQF